MSTGEYRLVLPAPWERVRLDSTMRDRVREIVGNAVARLPKDVSPDQVAPHRHRLEEELLRQLRAAKENGGIDYYLPTDLMHGQQLNASFVVAAVVPDAAAEPELVPKVLARLLSDPGTNAVSAGDTVWARSETVVKSDPDAFVGVPVAMRRVQYRTGVPKDHRRWVLVTFTTAGDGDVDSDATHLVVELFDAIMSTWRWL